MNVQARRWQRRGWLIAVTRYLLVGGIGLLFWKLAGRSAGSCSRFTLPCRDCSLLVACRLPRARGAQRQQRQTAIDARGVTR